MTLPKNFKLPSSLLTTHGTKIVEHESFINAIMYLDNRLCNSFCPYATKECRATCLINTGRLPMSDAPMRRAQLYKHDTPLFLSLLRGEILALKAKAQFQGKKLALRLNGTTDIVWEKHTSFMRELVNDDNIIVYDYTKIPLQHRNNFNGQYHLTFSYSGNNWLDCEHYLNNGGCAAVVFANEIPKKYKGFKVSDATQHDYRFLDTPGTIAGLKFKGAKRLLEVVPNFVITDHVGQ